MAKAPQLLDCSQRGIEIGTRGSVAGGIGDLGTVEHGLEGGEGNRAETFLRHEQLMLLTSAYPADSIWLIWAPVRRV